MWVENICIETVKIIQQISINFTISSTHTKCTPRSILQMYWQFLTKSLTGTEKQSTTLTKFYVTQIRLIRIFYWGQHLSEREIIFFLLFFSANKKFCITIQASILCCQRSRRTKTVGLRGSQLSIAGSRQKNSLSCFEKCNVRCRFPGDLVGLDLTCSFKWLFDDFCCKQTNLQSSDIVLCHYCT